MPRPLHSPRYKALRAFLIEERSRAGLTQQEVAKRLKRPQSFISEVEKGTRRVDAVELLLFAEAIGFDPREAIKRMMK